MSTVRGLRNSSLGDLAVGAPDGHEPHDLELAAREARGLVLGGGAAAEARLERLAEPRELGGGLRGERRGAERGARSGGPRRAARAPARARRRRPARRRRAAGSAPARTGSRARRCSSSARPSCCAAASASPSASAVSPSAWASAASASGWPVVAAIADSASAHARASREVAAGGEHLRGGAQAPDRVVVVLAALPALQHGAEVLQRGRAVARVVGEPAERGRAVDAHRDDVEPRGGRRSSASSSGQRARGRRRGSRGSRRARRRRPARRPGAASPAPQLRGRAARTASQSPSSRST